MARVRGWRLVVAVATSWVLAVFGCEVSLWGQTPDVELEAPVAKVVDEAFVESSEPYFLKIALDSKPPESKQSDRQLPDAIKSFE